MISVISCYEILMILVVILKIMFRLQHCRDGNYLKFHVNGKPPENMPWFTVGKEGGPIQ